MKDQNQKSFTYDQEFSRKEDKFEIFAKAVTSHNGQKQWFTCASWCKNNVTKHRKKKENM